MSLLLSLTISIIRPSLMRMDSEGILRFVSQLEGLGVLDEGSVTDCERVELDRFFDVFRLCAALSILRSSSASDD